MTVSSLPEKVLAVDEALGSARVSHAFGGALALAYYGEPRVTIDIDVNVFVGTEDYRRIAGALAPLGVDTRVELDELARDGQCRLFWDDTPIDLFFAYDEFHSAMRQAVRRVPFADRTIRVLSPEHLVVCKAAYDRAKDWLDIEQMLVAVEPLDVEEIRRWLGRFVGQDDPRFRRFEELAGRLRD